MLRYAGEFSGFRIAAGIGYERIRDTATPVLVDPLSTAAGALDGPKPDTQAWGGSLALMHVPSGIFVQGHYQAVSFDNRVQNDLYWGTGSICAAATQGQLSAAEPCNGAGNRKDAAQWLIQAGVAKNWFGLGNTALYGEYGKATDWGALDGSGRDYPTTGFLSNPFNRGEASSTNFGGIANVTDTDVTVWGLGITQNVDAAATTLYLGYRNFSAKLNGTEFRCSGGSLSGATTACTGVAIGTPSLEDLHVVVGGAVVRF
jgi:hypothetical protein